MVKVIVCIGSSCHLKGSRKVIEQLQYLVKNRGLDEDVDLGGAFCMGKCADIGVAVTVSHIEPMPIIRRFEPAVNEMRVAHSDRAKDITWALAFKTVKESQIFSERYGKGWIMNYKEFEKEIMKALDEKD